MACWRASVRVEQAADVGAAVRSPPVGAVWLAPLHLHAAWRALLPRSRRSRPFRTAGHSHPGSPRRPGGLVPSQPPRRPSGTTLRGFARSCHYGNGTHLRSSHAESRFAITPASETVNSLSPMTSERRTGSLPACETEPTRSIPRSRVTSAPIADDAQVSPALSSKLYPDTGSTARLRAGHHRNA